MRKKPGIAQSMMSANELGSLAPAPWSPAGGDPDDPASADETSAMLHSNAFFRCRSVIVSESSSDGAQ